MIGWIILAAVFVIFVLFILRFKEVKHKLGFFFVLAVILFFVVSAIQVYSNKKVDLGSFDGIVSAGKLYFSWLGSLFHNVKDISGYAVKQNWGLNETSK